MYIIEKNNTENNVKETDYAQIDVFIDGKYKQ